MKMVATDSTCVSRLGWENDELVIEFPSGTMYKYFGVDYSTFLEFLADRSKGRYFAKHIRDDYDSHKCT